VLHYSTQYESNLTQKVQLSANFLVQVLWAHPMNVYDNFLLKVSDEFKGFTWSQAQNNGILDVEETLNKCIFSWVGHMNNSWFSS
jgi:hypothetical protein